MAAAPLAAIPWVHRSVREWHARRHPSLSVMEASLPELHLDWYQGATYAGLVLVVLLQVGSFVGAFVVTWITANEVAGLGGGGGGGFVLALAGAYLLGRWIGARAASRHVVAALLMAAIALLVGVLVDAAVLGTLPDSNFMAAATELLGPRIILHLVPWAIAGVIGVWLVRRKPVVAYVRVVAEKLPGESLRELAESATMLADDAFADAVRDDAVITSSAAWSPTHRVPGAGLTAWAEPDPAAAPVATLQPGTEVRVVSRRGEWALVSAANGWQGWVDGRRLEV